MISDVKIYKYAYAYDFAEWVEFTFGIPHEKAYDMLLEADYVEGRLGSAWDGNDIYNTQINEWFQKFLLDYNLDFIMLKYGG